MRVRIVVGCLAALLLAVASVRSVAAAADIVWPPTAAELGLMQGSPAADDTRVTLANWQYGPHNRWAFQHVRELVPTVPVSRGEQQHRPFQQAARDVEAIEFEIDGEKRTILELLAVSYTDGFLVLHRGELVYERYLNGLTPERPHLLWSVSKSIAGVLAGTLAADGTLDLERNVETYVPELAKSGWAGNRLRDVLDMQTTSNWIEDYDDARSSVRRQDASNGLLPLPAEFADLPRGNYFFLPTIGGDAERANTFIYKSGDTDVAGWVMEQASGRRLAELLSERLWSRMGAEFDAYYTVDPSGSVLASGGLNATLRDIARVGQLMLDEGVVDGRRVVPADWVRDIATQRNTAAWEKGPHADYGPGGYRSFWWHTANPRGAYYAHGVHGQWIYVDPSAQVVIAKLSSHPEPFSIDDDNLALAGFDAIVRALDR